MTNSIAEQFPRPSAHPAANGAAKISHRNEYVWLVDGAKGSSILDYEMNPMPFADHAGEMQLFASVRVIWRDTLEWADGIVIFKEPGVVMCSFFNKEHCYLHSSRRLVGLMLQYMPGGFEIHQAFDRFDGRFGWLVVRVSDNKVLNDQPLYRHSDALEFLRQHIASESEAATTVTGTAP